MLRNTSSLLFPLATSLALHISGFTLMDVYYGGGLSGGTQVARHQAPLRVVFLDVRLASLGNESTGLDPDATGSSSAPLPEGIVSLPGPYYFLPQELSRKPQAAAPVPLDYPENAPLVANNHVVLRLLISETGDVDRIIVETADVPGELESLARQAFAKAKFQPGLRGETPVKSQMFVEITFEGRNVPHPSGGMLQAR